MGHQKSYYVLCDRTAGMLKVASYVKVALEVEVQCYVHSNPGCSVSVRLLELELEAQEWKLKAYICAGHA